MKVHPANSGLKLQSSILTIGALDGVHRGHQKLILKAKERANKFGAPLVVYTFDPPPRVFFKNTIQLTTLKEKINRLNQLGVDHMIVAQLDSQYLSREVNSFLDEIAMLNPLEVWEGEDFHFGKNREGDIHTLETRFRVHVVEPICCTSGKVISSSRIRLLIMQNMLVQAEQLLGWKINKGY